MYHINARKCKTKSGRYFLIGSIFVVIAIDVVAFLFVQTEKSELVIGKSIAMEDISEFYYTYSSSTYPPEYQRYHFYVEEEEHKFYHEKREGEDWPLTESHITLSGSIELSEEEWTEFLNFLEGGSVMKRDQSTESGGSGPWLYLYWKGDGDEYQVFSFATSTEEKAFEELCEKLVIAHKE